jgi:hypothetical protein
LPNSFAPEKLLKNAPMKSFVANRSRFAFSDFAPFARLGSKRLTQKENWVISATCDSFGVAKHRGSDGWLWVTINHIFLMTLRFSQGREASPSAGVIDSQPAFVTMYLGIGSGWQFGDRRCLVILSWRAGSSPVGSVAGYLTEALGAVEGWAAAGISGGAG